jgi:hypothetical protein
VCEITQDLILRDKYFSISENVASLDNELQIAISSAKFPVLKSLTIDHNDTIPRDCSMLPAHNEAVHLTDLAILDGNVEVASDILLRRISGHIRSLTHEQ